MRRPSKYMILFLIGFAIWIGENIFFGWNDKPESTAEKFLDVISWLFMIWGIIGDLISNVTIVKKHYNTFNETHNITTKEVKVTGKEPKIAYNFGTTKKETVDLLKLGRGDKKNDDEKSK